MIINISEHKKNKSSTNVLPLHEIFDSSWEAPPIIGNEPIGLSMPRLFLGDAVLTDNNPPACTSTAFPLPVRPDFPLNPLTSKPVFGSDFDPRLVVYAEPVCRKLEYPIVQIATDIFSFPEEYWYKFGTLTDLVSFENKLFIKMLDTREPWTQFREFGPSVEFLSAAFVQVEQFDNIATHVLISSEDVALFDSSPFDRTTNIYKNSELCMVGHIWSATVYSTNLLPSGSIVVLPKADDLGLYFHRPITRKFDEFKFSCAAIIAYPERLFYFRRENGK